MKVKIDLDLCQGHAVCLSEAPDVFELQDSADGYAQARVKIESISEELKETVRCAKRFCPNRAISIEE